MDDYPNRWRRPETATGESEFQAALRQTETMDGMPPPTGVVGSRRRPLQESFSALSGVSRLMFTRTVTLTRQTRTRTEMRSVPLFPIACPECQAGMHHDDDDALQWCRTCENRGYVCPVCRGARLTVDRRHRLEPILRACPACCVPDSTAKSGYRFDKADERAAVEGWLVTTFPYGVTVSLLDEYAAILQGRSYHGEAEGEGAGEAESGEDYPDAP